jgi:hypothetical protein
MQLMQSSQSWLRRVLPLNNGFLYDRIENSKIFMYSSLKTVYPVLSTEKIEKLPIFLLPI